MSIKINLLFFCLLFSIKVALCEAPYMINYQGVARTSAGIAIANHNVSIRASIVQGGIGGTVYYSEVRAITTDADGLFSFKINGPGATSVIGVFSSINWSNGTKYLQIEMDTNGGTNFVNMGTQQLVSVPYAQLANKADGLTPYGQMSIGAVAGDVIQFDGTNWKAATLIDGLQLPYLNTDPNLVSFAITNNSALGGSAITGKTTANNANATGVRGEATGTSGRGVYGVASNASSFGVLGQNTTGIGIKGISSTGKAIAGECTGSSGTAVYGLSNGLTGLGIYGESINGIGVKGYGNNTGSYGIYGTSLGGTGVYATSYSGLALEVNGNLKISGGNTNPSNDAILTSDATGNAHWQPNTRVAFKAQNVSQTPTAGTANHSFSQATWKKVEFYSEEHDLHNDFTPTGSNPATSSSSTFIAPVNGIYQFNSAVSIEDNYVFDYLKVGIRLVRKRSGTTTVLAEIGISLGTIFGSTAQLSVDKEVLAGDQLWIEFKQHNYSLTSASLKVEAESNYFTGHLIYQQ